MHQGLIDGFSYRHKKEMEKRAVLGLAALAGGMHVGVNALMKGVKTLPLGKKLLHKSFDIGYGHGLSKKRMNPVIQNALERGIGPESTVEYGLGRTIGRYKRLADRPLKPHQEERLGKLLKGRIDGSVGRAQGQSGGRGAAIKKFKKDIGDFIKYPTRREKILANMPDSIKKAPYLESMFSSSYHEPRQIQFGKYNPRRLLTVPGGKKSSPKADMVSNIMHAASLPLSPHFAVQQGISGIRKMVASSSFGKNMMLDQVASGSLGNKIPKWKEMAFDAFVSPAALDAHRIGKAYHKGLGKNVAKNVKKMTGQSKSKEIGPIAKFPFTEKLVGKAKKPGVPGSRQPLHGY